MEDKTHNGWTNYATWRVNLEIIDGWADYHTEDKDFEKFESVHDLADHLKDYAEETVDSSSGAERGSINLARGYAFAFMSDVNYYEIAKHMIEDYPKLLKTA